MTHHLHDSMPARSSGRCVVHPTDAAAEEAGDLEATMATLDDDPVYELQPMGLVLRGRETARAYYEHFFAEAMPRMRGDRLRSEWVTDEGVGQEYELWLAGRDGGRRHASIGILTFGTGATLSGERIYAADELVHLFFGPVLARAVRRSNGGEA